MHKQIFNAKERKPVQVEGGYSFQSAMAEVCVSDHTLVMWQSEWVKSYHNHRKAPSDPSGSVVSVATGTSCPVGPWTGGNVSEGTEAAHRMLTIDGVFADLWTKRGATINPQ